MKNVIIFCFLTVCIASGVFFRNLGLYASNGNKEFVVEGKFKNDLSSARAREIVHNYNDNISYEERYVVRYNITPRFLLSPIITRDTLDYNIYH